MNGKYWKQIDEAEKAARDVLKHNGHGPFHDLPRTAGWGYPEPYTRDLLIAIPGMLLTGDKDLLVQVKRVLKTLAENQSEHGHIPSLVHDPEDRGASDTTPLFLIGLAIFRDFTEEKDFLEDAADKALKWMTYQSPTDRNLIAQQPTTDWRDEQWVTGYGLFVNTLAYGYLRFYGLHEKAEGLRNSISRLTISEGIMHRHVHEGLVVKNKPYYAFWSFKIYSSERFDLLGNSLAILTGLAPPTRAGEIISWISKECENLKERGELAVDLPPNFFPFITKNDPDWLDRYEKYNQPGDYHNGGIWPFITGFYIAALVAAEKYHLAEQKLLVLTDLMKKSSDDSLSFGFNEWIKAQNGVAKGQDWQTWSAAMYIYAAHCVRDRKTPFFDKIRKKNAKTI
ncbi:MAG: hypothetical protein PF518_01640 [Spirochaetaceae bacterium]|jgi:hypothetical protein|nr:hypothetical protein [Spirochaetaceae bacterium]